MNEWEAGAAVWVDHAASGLSSLSVSSLAPQPLGVMSPGVSVSDDTSLCVSYVPSVELWAQS